MKEPPAPRRLQPHLSAGDDTHAVSLTHDEALVLFELFERLDETGQLHFGHPAEQTALGALHARLLPHLWEMFDADWEGLLREARARVAHGFEGHVAGLGHVRVEPDGSLTPIRDLDDQDLPP